MGCVEYKPRPDSAMQNKKKMKFFDEFAALTHDADASFDKFRKVYEDKGNRLLMPEKVCEDIWRVFDCLLP